MGNEVTLSDIEQMISDAPVVDQEPAPAPTDQEPVAAEPTPEPTAGAEPAPGGEPQPGEPPPSASPASPAPPPESAPAPAAAPAPAQVAEPQVEDKDAIIAALRSQLEEVSARLIQGSGQAGTAVPAPSAGAVAPGAPTPGEPAPAQPADLPVMEFVKDDASFDEALKSHENFNKLLTNVVYKSIESTLRSVPTIVTRLADQQITARSAINEFYTNNQDLVQIKGFVGAVAQEMAVKNPTWKMDDLLSNLGKEVRTRLKMGGSTIVGPAPGHAPPPPSSGPAFAGTGGGGNRNVQDQRSSLQKDIDSLISDL